MKVEMEEKPHDFQVQMFSNSHRYYYYERKDPGLFL
jgi:hypothetical protein